MRALLFVAGLLLGMLIVGLPDVTLPDVDPIAWVIEVTAGAVK